MSTVNQRATRRWGRKRYQRNVIRLGMYDALTRLYSSLGIDLSRAPADADEVMKGVTVG